MSGLSERVATAVAARFERDLAALIGRPLGGDEPIAVAVSGGPDSLALLALAHAVCGARVCVLSVDHEIRADSAAEAAAVAALAARLGLRHAVLGWHGAKPPANLQAAARAARYALLAQWSNAAGVRWLATAHHADDQAETLLMRAARGAGIGGLAGIRPVRALGADVTVLRPLLGWRRSELAAVTAATGWAVVDDPGNRAERFDRTRARALLAATPWLGPARLAAAAAHAGDAEAALAWAAELALASRCDCAASAARFDADGLPAELQRRVLAAVLDRLVPGATHRGPALERWRAALAAGRRTTLAGVVGTGGATWRFEIARGRAETGA